MKPNNLCITLLHMHVT